MGFCNQFIATSILIGKWEEEQLSYEYLWGQWVKLKIDE